MNLTKRIATAFFTASLALTVVGCSSTPTKESAGEYVDDSVITTKVKDFDRLFCKSDARVTCTF
jgi:hypothetical protein